MRVLSVLGVVFFLLCTKVVSQKLQSVDASQTEEATVPKPNQAELVVIERPFFLIAGYDFAGNHYVENICNEWLEMMRVYLSFREEFKYPVIVQLVPSQEASFLAPYTIAMSHLGEVKVSIRWGKDTEFGYLCQAIARGFLLSWAVHEYGGAVYGKIPPWLDIAMGLRLQTYFRPRMRDFLRSESKLLPTLSFEQVVSADSPLQQDVRVLGLHAYWLLEMCEDETTNRQQFSALLKALLQGVPTMTAIKNSIKSQSLETDAVLWWAVGFQNCVRSHRYAIHTLSESRGLLETYERLIVDIDGVDTHLNLRGLWQYRHRPTVQAAIQWRLRELKLDLHQINPVFYNALHSLGIIYESYLNRDADFFPQHERAYLREKSIAEKMEQTISRQLDGMEMQKAK